MPETRLTVGQAALNSDFNTWLPEEIILMLFAGNAEGEILCPLFESGKALIGRDSKTAEQYLFEWESRPKRRSPGTAPQSAKNIRAEIKKRQTPPWADLNAIKAIFTECRRRNRVNPGWWHVDHIIPLQGKFISGLHVETNLQIIPGKENLRKHNNWTAN